MYEFAEGLRPPPDEESLADWGQRWGEVIESLWRFQWEEGAAPKIWAEAEAELLKRTASVAQSERPNVD